MIFFVNGKMRVKLNRAIGCVLIICSGVLSAQMPADQSASPIIVDILLQLPAQQSHQYHQLMTTLLETGTEGVRQLVNGMNVQGKGDNSTVEYALNGMAMFASGDEILKNKMEQAVIASLDETNEPETSAFLIRLLAIVGSDDGIHRLAGYLTDDRLSIPAANAMISINGEVAGKTLQASLMSRMARSHETDRAIIQALGDVTPIVEGTEVILQMMLDTNDNTTKGIVLNALSKTGSKQSLSALAAAAAATGYRAEITDANGAYLRLIKRVYEQGEIKVAIDAAKSFLKNATKAGSRQYREAALGMLFYNRTDVLKTLKTALKDQDRSYRNAALRFSSDYADKAIYTELIKLLPKMKAVEKIDVLYWIGNEAQCPEKRQVLKTVETGIEKTGLQTLSQQLSDPDIEVKKATAFVLHAIGDPSTLPILVDLLKNKDEQTLACAKEVLASFPVDISAALTKVVNRASDAGKIIIMELLSERKANAYFTLVLEQTKNANPKVVNVAFYSLKDVTSEKDFIVLCGMLETTSPSFIVPLQQAVTSSIASLTPEIQVEMIINRMLQAGESKKHLYDQVLSLIDMQED